MYSFDSRVRYSESGEDRRLTLQGIINYFQDCSTFHSEEAGVGMEYLEKKKRIWVLSAWQIVVERYPRICERIRISTWPYEFKRFLGSRNFVMEDQEGKRLAYANTLWTYLDLETGHPVNVDQEQAEAYPLEKKLDMDYAPRKIAVPKECRTWPSFQVKPHHLDTNHHVNNGQYIQMAQEYLPGDFHPVQMRAEYKKQAVLGDVIVPRIHEEQGRLTAALENPQGEIYAVVELENRDAYQAKKKESL